MRPGSRQSLMAAGLVLAAGASLVAVPVPAQELEWATSAGGGSATLASNIATDARGNSFVTGFFRGTAIFGAGEANETVLKAVWVSGGSTIELDHAFVAKYARDGALVWATSAGGSSGSSLAVGNHIASDPRGNSYVTGSFIGSVTFGAGEANETALSSSGTQNNAFVAKYARDGTLLWATSIRGAGTGGAIAIDPPGNSYVTGIFSGTVTFGPGEANETILSSSTTAFVAKYARDGTLVWATSVPAPPGGPPNAAIVGDIATDLRGNSYVSGGFEGTVTFGPGEANETVLEAAGTRDIFLAKYARDGALVWVTSVPGAHGDFMSADSIATDPRGNSYLTGGLRGTATFGPGEANETILSSSGTVDTDVFVAKYAPDRTLVWVTKAGGGNFDLGRRGLVLVG